MKNLLLIACLLFAVPNAFAGGGKKPEAKQVTYQLSSHILDISKGAPATGVTIILEKQEAGDSWRKIDEQVTDAAGRVGNFLPAGTENAGVYKLRFLTKPYFQKSSTESFYPFIEVVFEVRGTGHYHVPITLSAWGYSTYRGN